MITPAKTDLRRNVLMATFGFAVGAVFMWFALREVDVAEVRRLGRRIDSAALAQAAAVYWLAMLVRALRWHRLLAVLDPVPLFRVGEILLVGTAVNNILPARLGELARALYAKRRLGISGMRALGSIVIERMLDLTAILLCLLAGLVALRWGTVVRLPRFELLAINVGVLVGVLILAVMLVRSGLLGRAARRPGWRARLDDLRLGLATLNRKSVPLAVGGTVVIWCCEGLALAGVFAAVGVNLSAAQTAILMGAMSLSTLVPTAPGYLGTYQLVAVLAMGAFAMSPGAGIVASAAMQLALYGSVTLVGFGIVGWRACRRVARRFDRAADARARSIGQ